MKLENTKLLQDPDKSFIVHHETKSFARWHHHAEYELVLIMNGKGKRMIGDHIDRFEQHDLVLLGSYLPHEYLCDEEYTNHPGGFQGKAIVYQFLKDFLGSQFFEIPENRNLNRILGESYRGLQFYGKTRDRLTALMEKSYNLDGPERFYSLMAIFRVLGQTREYKLLSSPGFMKPFQNQGYDPIQKALEYLVQHFQEEISMKEMLSITNMSNSAFCNSFKKTCRMTFKEYLLNVRVGYACKLLTEDTLNISQIAYNCGFENLSNFNRQFKKIKSVTPSQFQQNANSDSAESYKKK
ncbi:MAG: helix-turn-helix domain-containing protein [Bacteroidales bacterium]|nr:helix-turn-helix domain-containing protein [Bacteroidales bacterium]